MSEQSIQLRSQPSLRDINVSTDSAGRPIVPHGASQARKHCKYKPRFAEFSCTFVEASRTILNSRSTTDREIQGLSLRDACHGCGHTKGRVGLQEESQTDQRACVRISRSRWMRLTLRQTSSLSSQPGDTRRRRYITSCKASAPRSATGSPPRAHNRAWPSQMRSSGASCSRTSCSGTSTRS